MFKKIGKVALLSMLTVGSLSAELITIKANSMFCESESAVLILANKALNMDYSKTKDCFKYDKSITLNVADIYKYKEMFIIMKLEGKDRNALTLWHYDIAN